MFSYTDRNCSLKEGSVTRLERRSQRFYGKWSTKKFRPEFRVWRDKTMLQKMA